MRICSKLFVTVFAAFLGMCFFGCGVDEKTSNDIGARIKTLQQKGVPDSLLSDAKVLLIQIQSSKQYGGGASPKKLLDSAKKVLTFAEASFNTTAQQLKPTVESLRKSFDTKKQGLSGPQLRVADSLIVLADSSIKANQWPEANALCLHIETALTSLQNDEKKAIETKPKLQGTWIYSHKVIDKETKTNVVEKTTYSFAANGNVDCIEEKNGQSNENFKEDWKFQSTGTYALKGDTALINLKREKCLKQTYWNLKTSGAKPEWVKAEKPTYDSLITSGKKDRFVTFADLKANFKKH